MKSFVSIKNISNTARLMKKKVCVPPMGYQGPLRSLGLVLKTSHYRPIIFIEYFAFGHIIATFSL